jgi:hypothetical protein
MNKNFYNLDSHLSGGTALANLIVANSGVFTNTKMNQYVTSLLDGINVAAELGVSGNATIALTGGVATPSGTAVLNSIAAGEFAGSSCNSLNATVCNTVAVYGLGDAQTNSASVWGANFLAKDETGVIGAQLKGVEIDMILNGTPSIFSGLSMYSVGSGANPVYPNSNFIQLQSL